MAIRSLFQRSYRFAAKGPGYATAYTRWRAIRLVDRLHQYVCPPAWSSCPGLPAAGIAAGMLPTEIGSGLAEYLAARERPRFHFSVTDAVIIAQLVTEEQRAHTLSVAEALVRGKHTYRGVKVTFDTDPDWQHTPNDSMDWRRDLNRHYWFPTLARAWRYSGDDAFAEHAAWLLRHWMAHNPPDMRNPVWRPFEVATRLNNWVWGLFLLLDSAPFVHEGLGYLWQGLITQARYLYRNLEYHVMNNHLLIEAKTLAMLGLLFPEMPRASKWLQIGLEAMWTQVHRQFHPDGVHTEQATQYHCLCTGELWEMFNLLRRNDHSIPSDGLARFEAAVAFQIAIVKPDGHIPLFGDSSRHDLHRRFDARWASVWLGNSAPPVESPNEETRWLLGTTPLPDEPGSPPASCAFPHGGYAVMRDAATYLALDCGPFGDKMVPSHAHADALSLELFAFGKTLITDSGAFRYHVPTPWRNYFRGTRAHNTLMIDGQDQSVLVGVRQVERPAMATTHRWITSADLDLVEGSHDGYTRLVEPVTHRRRILFVKPDYWLVLDDVQGSGGHQLDWFYHLMPQAQTSLDVASGELRCQLGQAGLIIRPFWLDSVEARLTTGDEATYKGWVSLESGQKEAAPVLNYHCQADVPLRFGTLLYPYRADEHPSVMLHLPEVKPNTLALRLQQGAQDDLILLTDNGEANLLSYGDWQANASLFIVRQLMENKYRLILTDVTFVSWQTQTAFENEQAVSMLSITYNSS